MKIFLDSANISEIKEACSTGLIDGITTNPSLLAKSTLGILETIDTICSLLSVPVSVEVTATTDEAMLTEAIEYSKISKNVVIKVPVNQSGFKLAQKLTANGIKSNMTLCFSPMQALFAAKSGATYVSPFIGRLDDIGSDGLQIIQDIRMIYDNYQISTQILAASIRNINHVIECAKIGADCATVPHKIFMQMFDNVLTKHGLELFMSDWNQRRS